MFKHWFSFSKTKNTHRLGYEKVDVDDDRYNSSIPRSLLLSSPKILRHTFSFTFLTISCVSVFIVASGLGFIIGQSVPHISLSDFLLAPAGDIKQIWHYNQTFSKAPTKETEAAWLSIFPRGRGFFSHPSLSVNISGVAVFHELHCLSGIRLAYYDALNETYNQDFSPSAASLDYTSPDAQVDAANSHKDPHHIRHCFDYLRQALMCAADTNLEVIDWKIGGSTGWGFERQCRNYDEVVAWAEKWRRNSQHSIA